MSVPLFTSPVFQDNVDPTTHALLGAGNYAIDLIEVSVYFVDATGIALTAAQIVIFSSSYTIWKRQFYVSAGAGGFFSANSMGSMVYILPFPKSLILPRGDSISIKSLNYTNITLFGYGINIYGETLN